LEGIGIASVGVEQHGDRKKIGFKRPKPVGVLQKGVLNEKATTRSQESLDFFKDLEIFRRRINVEDIRIPNHIIVPCNGFLQKIPRLLG
jgi:hypothetical protein